MEEETKLQQTDSSGEEADVEAGTDIDGTDENHKMREDGGIKVMVSVDEVVVQEESHETQAESEVCPVEESLKEPNETSKVEMHVEETRPTNKEPVITPYPSRLVDEQ